MLIIVRSIILTRAGPAISLGRELGVRVELQEPTLLTAVSSDRHTLTTWRFCVAHEFFPRLACMPARDKGSRSRIVRHEALNHFAVAFWALSCLVCHSC